MQVNGGPMEEIVISKAVKTRIVLFYSLMGNLIRRKTIVSKMVVWVEDRWSWTISWRRPLFVLEEEIGKKLWKQRCLEL